MGDIADMMIDGTLCEGCGVYLGWSTGVPEYCHSCKEDGGFLVPASKKVSCPDCGKWVSPVGLDQHRKDKHGVKA